jgi:hypothetical protein
MNKKSIVVTICFLFVAGTLVFSGCSVKGFSSQPKSVSNNASILSVIKIATTTTQPSTEADVLAGKVLTDTVHGVKITFPTDYVSDKTVSNRIYFGSKRIEKVCKGPVGDGCPNGFSEEIVYDYSLNFVPLKSVSAIFKDLTVYAGSDGVVVYRNEHGKTPSTEKINGHDVVSHVEEGDGDSTYVMEVVGNKFNYVFQAKVQSGLAAEEQSSYEYIRSVIKNIEFLQ